MPKVTFTDHEKTCLYTHLLGKSTFDEFATAVRLPAETVEQAKKKAGEFLQSAMEAANEYPDEFKKIFAEQVEDSRQFFGVPAAVNRADVLRRVAAESGAVADAISLPAFGVGTPTYTKYSLMPGMGPDVIGEMIKALQAQATVPANQVDCNALIKYLQDNATALRPLLTTAIVDAIRDGGAGHDPKAIGNAVREALIVAAHPADTGTHPVGGVPNVAIYEMLIHNDEIKSGIRHVVPGDWTPRGGSGHIFNEIFGAAGVVTSNLGASLQTAIGKDVLLKLADSFERYAYKPDDSSSAVPVANRAYALAFAKSLRETANNNSAQGVDVANAILTHPNDADTYLAVGGGGANLPAIETVHKAAVGAGAGVILDMQKAVLRAVFNDVKLGESRERTIKIDGQDILIPDSAAERKTDELQKRVDVLSQEAVAALNAIPAPKDPVSDPDLAKRKILIGQLQCSRLEMLENNVLEKDRALQVATRTLETRAMCEVAGDTDEAGKKLQNIANWRHFKDARVGQAASLIAQLSTTDSASVGRKIGELKSKTAAGLFDESMNKKAGLNDLYAVSDDGSVPGNVKIISRQRASETLSALEALGGMRRSNIEPWLSDAINNVKGIIYKLQGKENPAAPFPENFTALNKSLVDLQKIFTGSGSEKEKLLARSAFDSMGYTEIAHAIAGAANVEAAKAAVKSITGRQHNGIEEIGMQFIFDSTHVKANEVIEAYADFAKEGKPFGNAVSISGLLGKQKDFLEKIQSTNSNGKFEEHVPGYFRKHIEYQYSSPDPKDNNKGKFVLNQGGVLGMDVMMKVVAAVFPGDIVIGDGRPGNKERARGVECSMLREMKGYGNEKFSVTFGQPPACKTEQTLLDKFNAIKTKVIQYQKDLTKEGGSPYEKSIMNLVQGGASQNKVKRSVQNSAAILKAVIEGSEKYFKQNPHAILLELQKNLLTLRGAGGEEVKKPARERVATIMISIERTTSSEDKDVSKNLAKMLREEATEMYKAFEHKPSAAPATEVAAASVSARPDNDQEFAKLKETMDKMKKEVTKMDSIERASTKGKNFGVEADIVDTVSSIGRPS